MEWWVWAAPTATLLAAALAFLGARTGARQKERAALRADWQAMFAMALGELSDGADARRRLMGRAILDELIAGDFATDRQRKIAEVVLERELQAPSPVPAVDPGDGDLDIANTTRENEDAEHEREP